MDPFPLKEEEGGGGGGEGKDVDEKWAAVESRLDFVLRMTSRISTVAGFFEDSWRPWSRALSCLLCLLRLTMNIELWALSILFYFSPSLWWKGGKWRRQEEDEEEEDEEDEEDEE